MDPVHPTYTALSGEGVAAGLRGIFLVLRLYESPMIGIPVGILLFCVLIVVVVRILRRRRASDVRQTRAQGKPSRVRCHRCEHVQTVPADQTTFPCEQCNTKLKRRTTPAKSS